MPQDGSTATIAESNFRSLNRLKTYGLIATIMVYPAVLVLFHGSGRLAVQADGVTALLAWSGAIVFLLLVFTLPVMGFFLAFRNGRQPTLTKEDLRLRILSHFAFATPPLYSATGAYFILFGIGGYDPYVWAGVWALVLVAVLARAEDSTPVNTRRIPPRWLRISHGAAAAIAVFTFIIFHLLHNASGLLGAEFYNDIQAVLRNWYQSGIVEPLIIAAFLLLMVSGLVLAKYRIASFRDTWGTILTLTGGYLAAFLFSHMTAALIIARWKFGIETDWGWAAGEPPGLFADRWSVRLIPYYTLAPMAALAHIACGLRIVLTANGTALHTSERIARIIMAVGVLLGTLTILALVGLRLGD